MDFLKKFRLSSSKEAKKEGGSWGVILKGVPDKKVEEALIRIFTERLRVPGEDAQKIIRSAPLILFSDRTARDAEQIKLLLNQTGARTAISNDPGDFRILPRVAWPGTIDIADLAGEDEIPAPPESLKPVIPSPPKIPMPPAPPLEDWKMKYENLYREFLALKNSQSEWEKEKSALETEKLGLTQEKGEALAGRQQAALALEEIRKELIRSQEIRGTLQKEINLLRVDREKPIPEIEKIKTGLEVQLKLFENLLETLKGPARPELPIASPITPLKRPAGGSKGSVRIGIIPPST